MQEINKLLEIVQQLRDPKLGCPWDLEQTYQSMIPYLLEESYEVVETLNTLDFKSMQEELGDLLLQVIFLSQLASEDKQFDFTHVVTTLNQKLIFRHPHVFGEQKAQDGVEALKNWEAQKLQERTAKQLLSALDDIPHALPALLRAEKLQKRIAKIEQEDVSSNILIERAKTLLNSLETESKNDTTLAQLLYCIVNLCRQSGFKAESLLREENTKQEQFAREKEKLTK